MLDRRNAQVAPCKAKGNLHKVFILSGSLENSRPPPTRGPSSNLELLPRKNVTRAFRVPSKKMIVTSVQTDEANEVVHHHKDAPVEPETTVSVEMGYTLDCPNPDY